MRLSQVCRAWRNVIHYAPLWTRIRIDLRESLSKLYWIKDVLLNRIGRQPVSLDIVYEVEKMDESMWTKLSMINARLLELLRVELYRELELSGHFYKEQDDEILLSFFFSVSAGEALPCVEKLTLSDIGGVDPNFRNDLPSLTNLSIARTDRIHLLSVILRCSNLQDAPKWIPDLEDEEIEPEDEVVRSIRVLSVDHGPIIDLIAENIEMPHIKSITISQRLLSDPDELFNDLEELTYLSVCDLSPDILEDLALAAMNLKTLYVGGPSEAKILPNWGEKTSLTEPPLKRLEALEI
ncbi:hypothetical protein FS842_002301 [Serendipita sp. 407]|nr:hypothetical protein FS842_002301 [Serendipita sp. 407]